MVKNKNVFCRKVGNYETPSRNVNNRRDSQRDQLSRRGDYITNPLKRMRIFSEKENNREQKYLKNTCWNRIV